MKIAVVGASGMVGSRIVQELQQRGHTVTAVTRKGSPVDGATSVAGDIGDAQFVQQLAADHDAIVSATGPSRTGGSHDEWVAALENAAQNLNGTTFFVVGGAGSLLVDGHRLVDSPDFPDAYKQEALTAARVLDYLRTTPDDVHWIYLSPAPVIAPGERTGTYQVADDTPAGDHVSAENFAVAVVDELEQPKHLRARFTVAD